MGSGESDATAGSNNEKAALAAAAQKRNHSSNSKKQNELERPVQPGLMTNHINSSDDELDNCEDEDDDDWMFKTFTGGKKGGVKNLKPTNSNN